MSKKPPIFLIKNEYKVFGGGELQTILLANLLSKKYEVFLFTSVDELLTTSMAKNIKKIKTKVYKIRLIFNIKINLFSAHILLYNLYKYVYYYLKYKPKIIHFHSNDDLFLAPIFLKTLGAKIVRTDHADLITIIDSVDKKQRQKISSRINFCTEKLIFVSQYCRKLVLSKTTIKKEITTVVYNASASHYEPVKKIDSKNTITIGILSRLSKEKGIDLAIRAVSIVAQKQEIKDNKMDIKLLIAGEGPDKTRLKKVSKEVGLEPNFLGYVKNSYSFLSKLDIFLNLSKTESFGVSVLEAMSIGLPVIATAVGGLKEQITHKVNGLLVDKRDPQKVADLINLLIKNNKLRNKISKNSVISSKKFSTAALLNNTIKIYNSIL